MQKRKYLVIYKIYQFMPVNYILNSLKILASLLVVTVVGACAQVTESQWAEFCANTYWEQHGESDGKKGLSYKLVAVYKERCGEQFSKDEIKQYKKGYIAGIKEFCNYDNGYKLGYRNESNPKSCPFELANNFNKGFREGRSKYFVEKSIRENAIREVETEESYITSPGPELP